MSGPGERRGPQPVLWSQQLLSDHTGRLSSGLGIYISVVEGCLPPSTSVGVLAVPLRGY